MKFLHMADMHFDSPFIALAGNSNLAQARRMEQRKVFKEIVEYIKENKIEFFFISGDLYEQEYIKKSTIEYINNLFKEIDSTEIFITPGNHDPYLNNSFYKQFKWNKNVHIFTNKLEIINIGNIAIYGYGFNDFYMENKYQNIRIEDHNKVNILITHGNLDSGMDREKPYNPLLSSNLKKMEFDYIALGHIHKKSYNDYDEQRIVYPGSTVSLGFDELGERGFIVGEISSKTNKSLNLKFVRTLAKTFEEFTLDVSDIESEETLIEKINELNLDNTKFYKLNLVGRKEFEPNINEILKLIDNKEIIRIRDNTQIKYNIEEIANQFSLKGLFAKKILDKIKNNKNNIDNDSCINIENLENMMLSEEELLKSFEIGMDILNK